jgi:hypothetical protein
MHKQKSKSDKMKKILLLIALFSISVSSGFSQANEGRVELPLNEEGKIFIEKIYEVDSTLTREELFLKAKTWLMNLTSTDKNEQLIRLQDKTSGKLFGKGYVTFKQTNYGKVPNRVPFKFEITTKDGKYRVRLHSFGMCQIWDNFTTAITNRIPHWSDDWDIHKLYSYYKEGRGRKKVIASKVEPFAKEIERLLTSLNEIMDMPMDDDF